MKCPPSPTEMAFIQYRQEDTSRGCAHWLPTAHPNPNSRPTPWAAATVKASARSPWHKLWSYWSPRDKAIRELITFTPIALAVKWHNITCCKLRYLILGWFAGKKRFSIFWVWYSNFVTSLSHLVSDSEMLCTNSVITCTASITAASADLHHTVPGIMQEIQLCI